MNKVHKITKAIAIVLAALALSSTMTPAKAAASRNDPDYRITTAAEYYEYTTLAHEATPYGFSKIKVDKESVKADAQNITLQFPNEMTRQFANLLYKKDINNTTLTYADTVERQAVHPTDAIFQQLGVTDSSQKMSLLDAFASAPYTAPEIYLSKSDFSGLDFDRLVEDSKDNIGYYILDRFEFGGDLYNFYNLDKLIDSRTTARLPGGYWNRYLFVIERRAEYLKKIKELHDGIDNEVGRLMFAAQAVIAVESHYNVEIASWEGSYNAGGSGITKEQGDQAEAAVEQARGYNAEYIMKYLGYDAKLVDNGSILQYIFKGTTYNLSTGDILKSFHIDGVDTDSIFSDYVANKLNMVMRMDSTISNAELGAQMNATFGQLPQQAIDYKNEASYGMLPIEVSNSGFIDVTKGSDLDTALTKLVGAGIISGVGGAKYAPNGSLTREQASKIIVTLLKLQNETPDASSFPDVTSDNWSQSYVSIAYKHGLMKGLPSGNFGRTDLLTSGQLLTMMNRALKEDDKVTAIGLQWPAGDIANAKADGLIDGINVSDGSQGITRGETALIVYRTLNLLIQKGIVK